MCGRGAGTDAGSAERTAPQAGPRVQRLNCDAAPPDPDALFDIESTALMFILIVLSLSLRTKCEALKDPFFLLQEQMSKA